MIAVTEEQARRFGGAFGLSTEILARCSTLLCLELMSYHYDHGVNPHTITDEILALEGVDRRPRGTKPPEQFRREPLRGLWKKHFFSAHFLPQNVLNALKDGSLDRLLWDALGDADAPEGETHEEYARRLSLKISRIAVHESFLERQRATRVTGEWVVYAPHPTGNHYLSLARHREGDEVIREKIVRLCVPEFPFLRDVLRVSSDEST